MMFFSLLYKKKTENKSCINTLSEFCIKLLSINKGNKLLYLLQWLSDTALSIIKHNVLILRLIIRHNKCIFVAG